MRPLVDECVDERLRLLFPGHERQPARFANLAGLKNRRLLEAAEEAGFDVPITADQNIPDQQNLSGRKIALVILCGPTNRLRDLEKLAPAAISAIASIGPGDVMRIRWPAGWRAHAEYHGRILICCADPRRQVAG